MSENYQSKRVNPEEIQYYKKQELDLLEQKIQLIEGLPHLHGWKWYPWARKIFDSYNHNILCTAANQVSKSSTAIRKNIEWACNKDIWKKAWPDLKPGQVPNLFYYFYPNKDVATVEFETKWVPLFLPRGEFKKHPMYGWTEEYDKNFISAVRFNSGVYLGFRTYEQKVTSHQAGTAYKITCDEECPEDLIPEIQARMNASDGYFLHVFTATLGQYYWERAMEPKTPDEETYKDALKLQVSLYDCLSYEDGTSSHWTEEKIQRAIARCGSEAEILRRIHGRFVKSEGLRFWGFERDKNLSPPHPLPQHWHIYSGVDPGSGGSSGHPAAIAFIAVAPDFKQGRIFRSWRGDKIATSNQDVLNKYRMLKVGIKPVMNH